MSERLTPEEQAEIRRHLEGLDGWLEDRTRRLLDNVEALEKTNDGSIERSYREASKVAIDILWSEHPEIPYESPKQVLEWLKAERDSLRAQLEQVDDVLTVNWVGPHDDDNYRKALADLVANAIREHDDPAVNEDAARKRDEMAALRVQLRNKTAALQNEAIECGQALGLLAKEREECATLHAQLEREKANHEDTASVRDYHENTVAALRARCEQLQRENEALVHGEEAGPTR